jgi:hypothetical protein
MLTVLERGTDVLSKAGKINIDEATVLRKEARRRVEAGEFFGHISFLSVIARKASP